MPDPNLTVSLLAPDEAKQYMQIRHAAFVDDINKILYFNQNPPSETTLEDVTAAIREATIAKKIMYIKCLDTSTGKLVAGARWRTVRPTEPATERTWADVEAGLSVPEPHKESHPEVHRVFFEQFNACKRRNMGTRSYWALDTLVTMPGQERRGAGSMLLRWGCEQADAEGLEVYLEASEAGEPLYARFGFEVKERIELDLKRWGGDDVIRWAIMVRPSKDQRASSA